MALTGQETAEILIALRDDVSKQLKQITSAVRGVGKAAKKGQADRSGLSSWMKSLGVQALATAGITLGLRGAIAGVGLAVKTLVEGERINNMRIAFQGLDAEANKVLSTLRQSTGGLLSDQELTRFSVATRGAQVDLKDLARIADLSFKLAAAQGLEASDVMQRFGVAVLTGRTAVVDQFGIIIQADKELRKYAKSVNRNVDELTAMESQQVKMNAVLRQAEKVYGDVDLSKLNFGLQEASKGFDKAVESAKGWIAAAVFTAVDFNSDVVADLAFALTHFNQVFAETTDKLPDFTQAMRDAADAAEFLDAEYKHLRQVSQGTILTMKGLIEATKVQGEKLLDLSEIRKEMIKIQSEAGAKDDADLESLKKRKVALDALLPSIDAEIKRLGRTNALAHILQRFRKQEIERLAELIPALQNEADATKKMEKAQSEFNAAIQTFVTLDLRSEIMKTTDAFREGSVSAAQMFLVFKAGAEDSGLKGFIADISAGLRVLQLAQDEARKQAERDAKKPPKSRTRKTESEPRESPLGVTESDRLELQILSGLFNEAEKLELQYQADVSRARIEWETLQIDLDKFSLKERKAFFAKRDGLNELAAESAAEANRKAFEIAQEQIKREAILEGLGDAEKARLERDLNVKFGFLDAELAGQQALTAGLEETLAQREQAFKDAQLVAESVAAGFAGALSHMQSIVGTLANDQELDNAFLARAESLGKFAESLGTSIAASLHGTSQQISDGAANTVASMGGLVSAFASDARVAAGIMAVFSAASALLALPNLALAGKYAASAVMYGAIAGGLGVSSKPSVTQAPPSIAQTAAAPAAQGQTEVSVTVYNSGPAFATQEQIFESVIKGVNASARYGTLKIAKQAVEG